MPIFKQANAAIIAGSLHEDPEKKVIAKKDKDGNDIQLQLVNLCLYCGKDGDKREYANVAVWRELAPFAATLKKNDSVLIVATSKMEEYTSTKTGERVSAIKYTATFIIKAPNYSGTIITETPTNVKSLNDNDKKDDDDTLPF